MGNSKSTRYYETEIAVQEAWRDSKFTLQEVEMWHKDFMKQHPDGRATLNDFKNMYREICANGNPDALATYVFRLFDIDGDRTLSFPEFICGISMTSVSNPKERLDWVFKLYDLDRDGFITAEEMKQILEAVFKMNPNPTIDLTLKLPLGIDEITPQKITERIFEKYDNDKDGKLSKEELLQSVQDDPYLARLLA